jgi:2-amino-4-hydroxy-6-hydroxymethyldihydropteridine diphosphokinase
VNRPPLGAALPSSAALPSCAPSRVALVALGSSLGDRHRHLGAAVALLRATGGLRLRAASRPYRTRPVGPARGWFLNAVVALDCEISPIALLHRCQWIEGRLGRQRSLRWTDRVIDLDVLMVGEVEIDLPELTLPHPRMAGRSFVLRPAAEVCGPLILPAPEGPGGSASIWPLGPGLAPAPRWALAARPPRR